MKLVKTISEVKDIVKEWKKEGLSIGFVPTMGYLHEGHGSLITKARENNDRVVVSIFVNPMQFGENEDLDSYPRDIDKDSAYVEKLGGDLIFNPEPVSPLLPLDPFLLVNTYFVPSESVSVNSFVPPSSVDVFVCSIDVIPIPWMPWMP